jgi:hypothetical protein
MYSNEQRTSETNLVPATSTICEVKTEHSRLNLYTNEESVTY